MAIEANPTTKNLEALVAKIRELPTQDVLTLSSYITELLRERVGQNDKSVEQSVVSRSEPIPAEIEAKMIEIFGAEEWAEIKNTNITDLPPLPKSLSEYVNEGRGSY